MKHFIETVDELLELVQQDRCEGDTFPYASEAILIIDRKGYNFKVRIDEKSGKKFVISQDIKFDDLIKAMAKQVGFADLKYWTELTREEDGKRLQGLEKEN